MNYRDVYFSRVNYFGETTAERIKNSGILAFEKWMAQSPFTVTDLSVERGYYFSGIIETSKDKEELKIMYLYVANDIPIKVGDILTWRQDNGAIEKWLLLQQIHKVHPTYQTFQIIKCNFELKWIDFKGYLRKSWAYAVSSVDSKVKSNFRMWHSLISPQPNKFAEVIMPRPIFEEGSEDLDRLMRGITFIIENEGWQIIECDWTSVEGISYMSLTESKVNYHYDDRNIDVAETDRYKFPALLTLYKIGDTIVPQFEHDTLNQWEIEMRPSDFSFVSEVKEADGMEEKWYSELHPIKSGNCIIITRIKNRPAVTQQTEVVINAIEDDFIAYISGQDEIRLDRYATYTLVNEATKEKIVLGEDEYIEFAVENKQLGTSEKKKIDLATLSEIFDDNGQPIPSECKIHANSKNELGEVILTAYYKKKVDDNPENDVLLNTYIKTIKIVPLW